MQRYRAQLESIQQDREGLKAKDGMFGKVRAILFFLALVFWLVGYGFDGVRAAGWIGWFFFAAFIAAVVANEPVRDRLAELTRHRSVVQRLIARLNRDWEQLATKSLTKQLAEIELPAHGRDVAGDLDLLGRASLFHLVSMAATTPGIRTLALWLAGPADAAIAVERAEAVNAIAPLREERLRFFTLAREVGDSTGDPDQFVGWATSTPWLAQRQWLCSWAKVSTIIAGVFVGGLVVGGFGFLSADLFRFCLYGAIVLMVINLLITTMMLGPAHAIFSIAMANRQAVSNYQEIFSAASWLPESKRPGSESFLTRIRSTMLEGERSATAGMQQLQKIASAGGLRQSAATFLIYLPLQCLTLWDVKVLQRLEAWQVQHADVIAQWFAALGELESLVSIAALRDDYPGWATQSFRQFPSDIPCCLIQHGWRTT
jgi:hypothetical protein